jgi:hypothetical protein
MSQNGNDGNNTGVGPRVSWATKAGYIGTGVLVGLIIYPFVRKALGKLQPKVDEFFNDLTGRAEDFAERASDLMAKAKDNLKKRGTHSDHSHAHSHEEGETVQ